MPTLARLPTLVLMVVLGGPTLVFGATAASPYTIVPALPAWVTELPLPKPNDTPMPEQRPDVVRLLRDSQVRVARDGDEAWFLHSAFQITSPAGVQDNSEISITFDPSFERLQLHRLNIVRDGVAKNVLAPKLLRVIHQEDEIDRRILNGRVTVMALLEDVRVGDIVELAYSLNGQNPALNGHFSTFVWLTGREPVRLRRHRMLWAKGRPELHVRSFGALPEALREDLGVDEAWTWQASPSLAWKDEEGQPGWYIDGPALQFSDFPDWRAVATWGASLLQDASLTPEMQRYVAAQREKHANAPEALAAALIAFVQDDIRYLGIEMGPAGFVPNPAKLVFERRFGDCKDKAGLLVALARHAGFAADVVLVSTTYKQGLDDLLPGNFFDHAIVRLDVNGATHFVDATYDHQRGPLAQRPAPPYRRALVLDKETRALANIPTTPLTEPETFIYERYDVPSNGGAAKLRVITRYTGDEANAMRRRVATEARTKLESSYREFYEKREGQAEATEPLSIRDDVAKNTLEITEHYHLNKFWSDASHDFDAWAIRDVVHVPASAGRTMPYAVSYPSHVRHLVEVHLPEHYNIDDETNQVTSDVLSFSRTVRFVHRTLFLDHTFKTLRDHVAPDDVARYAQDLERIRDVTWFGIQSSRAGHTGELPLESLVALGLLFTTPFWLVPLWQKLSRYRAAARGRRFKKLGVFQPGEAPETAIVVQSEDDVVGALKKLRCACGQKRHGPIRRESSMMYADQRLTQFSTRCEACQATEFIYAVEPGPLQTNARSLV